MKAADAIHTPLTVADRDAIDSLCGRIERHAMIVNHTLSTWEHIDELLDLDRETLQAGLIELVASVVTDADAMRGVLKVAEKRTGAR